VIVRDVERGESVQVAVANNTSSIENNNIVSSPFMNSTCNKPMNGKNKVKCHEAT